MDLRRGQHQDLPGRRVAGHANVSPRRELAAEPGDRIGHRRARIRIATHDRLADGVGRRAVERIDQLLSDLLRLGRPAKQQPVGLRINHHVGFRHLIAKQIGQHPLDLDDGLVTELVDLVAGRRVVLPGRRIAPREGNQRAQRHTKTPRRKGDRSQ